jgi:hypothetical protein
MINLQKYSTYRRPAEKKLKATKHFKLSAETTYSWLPSGLRIQIRIRIRMAPH